MISAIVITHGDLGKELLEVARSVVGEQPQVEAISLFPGESPAELRMKLDEVLRRLSKEDGVIIFTDMFGGTPTNASLPLTVGQNIELLTGVNLPMILEFFTSREVMTLPDLVQKVKQTGQKTIINAKEMFLKKLKKSTQ